MDSFESKKYIKTSKVFVKVKQVTDIRNFEHFRAFSTVNEINVIKLQNQLQIVGHNSYLTTKQIQLNKKMELLLQMLLLCNQQQKPKQLQHKYQHT